MENIKKVEDVVRGIMECRPEARNSDNILYSFVISEYNPLALKQPLGEYLRYFKDLHIPRFETVARCRRKLQEKNEHLRGAEDVRRWREENETRFFNYAKEYEDE